MFRSIYSNLYEQQFGTNDDKAKRFAELFPGNDLCCWTKQGILLLNSALTCEEGKAGTHFDLWRPFISHVIQELAKLTKMTFILWGDNAITFAKTIKDVPTENYVNSDWGPESKCWFEAMQYLQSNNRLDRFEYDYSPFIDFDAIGKDFTEKYKEKMSPVLFKTLMEYNGAIKHKLITQTNINLTTNQNAPWI